MGMQDRQGTPVKDTRMRDNEVSMEGFGIGEEGKCMADLCAGWERQAGTCT